MAYLPGMTTEQQVVAWLNANIDTEGDSAFLGKLTAFLREKVQAGHDVILEMGPNTMQSSSAVTLSVFGGQLFVAPLTAQQSMAILDGPGSVSARDFAPNYVVEQVKTAQVALPTLAAEGPLSGSGEVRGRIALQVLPGAPQKPALRMVFRIENITTQRLMWLDENPSPGLTVIDFKYDAINDDAEGSPYRGPMLLAFDLCTVDDSGEKPQVKVHSNSAIILVDVN